MPDVLLRIRDLDTMTDPSGLSIPLDGAGLGSGASKRITAEALLAWIEGQIGSLSLPVSIANGGTGQTTATAAFNALSPMSGVGDIIYGSTSGAGTRLPGNTATTKKVLSQTGTGSASTAPAWDTAPPRLLTVDLATTAALPACTYYVGSPAGVGATLTGNANGALSIDGVTVVVGYNVLIKNQGSPTGYNGVYTVTQVGDGSHPFILTRHTDMDEISDFTNAIIVVNSTSSLGTNLNTIWRIGGIVALGPVTPTALSIPRLSGVQAGTNITITGNNVINATFAAGVTDTQILYFDSGAGGVTGSNNFTWDGSSLTLAGNVQPSTSGTYSLGNVNNRWNVLYVTLINDSNDSTRISISDGFPSQIYLADGEIGFNPLGSNNYVAVNTNNVTGRLRLQLCEPNGDGTAELHSPVGPVQVIGEGYGVQLTSATDPDAYVLCEGITGYSGVSGIHKMNDGQFYAIGRLNIAAASQTPASLLSTVTITAFAGLTEKIAFGFSTRSSGSPAWRAQIGPGTPSTDGLTIFGPAKADSLTLTTALSISYGGTGQTSANAALNALLPSQTSNSGKVLSTNGTNASWIPAGGTGTVTSVDMTVPSFLSVSGNPVTASGTLAVTLANQSANTVFAGPTSGGAAAPAFRALVATDIPTLTASKISDFDTQVRTSRLDQMAVPTSDVSMNNVKITNLGTPSSGTDATTKNYVDGLMQGFVHKPTAQAATIAALPTCTYANGSSGVGATLTGNSNGALTVDSYAVSAGDRILVLNQASGFQNGLYDVTQAGSGGTPFILTRNVNMDAAAEYPGAVVIVEDAGTVNAGSIWYCSNSAAPTVGTTAIAFVEMNKAADLSAGTGISLTANVVAVTGNLLTLRNLSNAGGWLNNNGSGTLSWSTPTKSDVGLGSVENTALSTWAGSSNITTLGAVSSCTSLAASGVISGSNLNANTTFTGPTTSVKTFTLPNASCTILTTNAAVTIGQGGTGQTTKGPAFDALSPMTTLGDVIYGDTSGTGTRLAGQTTTSFKALTQTGTGSASAAPVWNAVVATLTANSAAVTVSTTATTGAVTVDLNLANANTWTAAQTFQAGTSGSAPLIAKANASGTVPPFQIQKSDGTVYVQSDNNGYFFPDVITFLLGVGTAAVTGTTLTCKGIANQAGKIVKCWAVAVTGPTGADLICDINLNGTSIWASTQANRIKIVAGQTTGNQTSFDTTTFVAGDLFSIDIDQVGSTIAGQDITIELSVLLRNN